MKQVAKFFDAPLLRKKRKKTLPPDSRFVKKVGKEKNVPGKERTGKGEGTRTGRLLTSARGFPFVHRRP